MRVRYLRVRVVVETHLRLEETDGLDVVCPDVGEELPVAGIYIIVAHAHERPRVVRVRPYIVSRS